MEAPPGGAAEQAEQFERRLATLEWRASEQAEQIARVEAAVIGDVARAAVAEGWTVERADEGGWGPGWYEFKADDGSDALITAVHPESELVATFRERGMLRLEGLRNGVSSGDWTASSLWPKTKK